jgi:hypothetical protein
MVKKRRANDGPWRRRCLEERGAYCRSCGEAGDLQLDHVKPKSQGGKSVVENGLVLCGPWSKVTPGGCHLRKTDSRMLIRREWLDADQIEWLAREGWVAWDDDGEPYGAGMRHFAPADERSRSGRNG